MLCLINGVTQKKKRREINPLWHFILTWYHAAGWSREVPIVTLNLGRNLGAWGHKESGEGGSLFSLVSLFAHVFGAGADADGGSKWGFGSLLGGYRQLLHLIQSNARIRIVVSGV